MVGRRHADRLQLYLGFFSVWHDKADMLNALDTSVKFVLPLTCVFSGLRWLDYAVFNRSTAQNPAFHVSYQQTPASRREVFPASYV
jgi:hypothetical protein